MLASAPETFLFTEWQTRAYDLNCRRVELGNAPVSAMVFEVAPGGKSKTHNHVETEIFLILSGQGHVQSGNVSLQVSEGMGVRLPPFQDHVIVNGSTVEPLKFLSFYWIGDIADLDLEQKEKVSMKRNLIFSTPPTPNGDLHLGHLSGPYLAADICRRFLESTGASALHVTGRDDNQTYVVTKAQAQASAPHAVATDYANKIRETLTACNISTDHFITPDTDGPYSLFVQRVFKELFAKGYIVEQTELAAYSTDGSDRYLHEAHIRGFCPHCSSESDGNACEHCGRPNVCVDLKNAIDRKSGKPIVYRECRRLYFKLSALADKLSEYVKSASMSARALAVSQKMLDDGLPNICVSHPGNWGISVPIVGFEDQRIYVWFEMAAGYLWGALNCSGDVSDKDPVSRVQEFYGNKDASVVHFYGFDNTYYHTLLFPAIYLALGWGLRPPQVHVVNELLDLEGKKFSTSRNHLVWGRDILSRVSADYVRWHLCEIRPEGNRSDFTLDGLINTVNNFICGTIQSWLMELSKILDQDFDEGLPEPGAWNEEHRNFLEHILSCHRAALRGYHLEAFSPRTVTNALRSMACSAEDFTRAQQCLTGTTSSRDYLRTAMALSALGLKIFSLLVRPLMPGFGAALLKVVRVEDSTTPFDTSFLPTNTRLRFDAAPNFLTINREDFENIVHYA